MSYTFAVIVLVLLAVVQKPLLGVLRRHGGSPAAFGLFLAGFCVGGMAVWGLIASLGGSLERHEVLLWLVVASASVLLGFVIARHFARVPGYELLAAALETTLAVAALASVTHGLELASPVFRVIIVLPAALILCGYLGASLGFLTLGGDYGWTYEGLLGRRFLLSKSSPVVSTVTTISVIGVSLGVTLVIVALGVLGGFEHDLETKIIGANAHITVNEKQTKPFVLQPALTKAIGAAPGVVAQNPVVEGEVAVASNANYTGALFFGVEPFAARKTLLVLNQIIAGSAAPLVREEHELVVDVLMPSWTMGLVDALALSENLGVRTLVAPILPERLLAGIAPEDEFLPPKPLPHIVLGVEMAKGLNLSVGSKVRVISPMLEALTPVGPAPKSLAFEVAGIFSSEMYEYDARYVFVSLGAARRFLEIPDDEVTAVQVLTDRPNLAGETADNIEDSIENTISKDFVATDWQSKNQTLFSALKLERVVAFIVLIFIVLVASFSIVNTLTMSVVEKTREIAILKAMGARESGIMKMFLVQGLIVGAFGTLIGAIVGVTVIAAVATVGFAIPGDAYYIDALPVHLEAADVVLVVASALLIVWDFAVFPALRGARLLVVEGLRDG